MESKDALEEEIGREGLGRGADLVGAAALAVKAWRAELGILAQRLPTRICPVMLSHQEIDQRLSASEEHHQ